ncbi:hypothetical protein EJ06DRAFT_582327 [Trichodelitschia bisporula]|uniref:Uncharacterized protein n=1 Tax=Trichodelitschia bisporula TaxID=703511 RepID=A0A6G1HXF6_9PEZI|nr:hypothetical protein EJ06DRAFT_582327 [Trichodelitschia bisporula]
MRVLAHISAPTSKRRDDAHRAEAQAYMDFEPSNRLPVLQQGSDISRSQTAVHSKQRASVSDAHLQEAVRSEAGTANSFGMTKPQSPNMAALARAEPGISFETDPSLETESFFQTIDCLEKDWQARNLNSINTPSVSEPTTSFETDSSLERTSFFQRLDTLEKSWQARHPSFTKRRAPTPYPFSVSATSSVSMVPSSQPVQPSGSQEASLLNAEGKRARAITDLEAPPKRTRLDSPLGPSPPHLRTFSAAETGTQLPETFSWSQSPTMQWNFSHMVGIGQSNNSLGQGAQSGSTEASPTDGPDELTDQTFRLSFNESHGPAGPIPNNDPGAPSAQTLHENLFILQDSLHRLHQLTSDPLRIITGTPSEVGGSQQTDIWKSSAETTPDEPIEHARAISSIDALPSLVEGAQAEGAQVEGSQEADIPESSAETTADGSDPDALVISRIHALPKYVIAPDPPANIFSADRPPSYMTKALQTIEDTINMRQFERCLRHQVKLPAIRERGYWVFDTSSWPLELQAKFWESLQRFVTQGKAGIATWTTRDHKENAEQRGLGLAHVYCYGHIARHIWLALFVLSENKIRRITSRWMSLWSVDPNVPELVYLMGPAE